MVMMVRMVMLVFLLNSSMIPKFSLKYIIGFKTGRKNTGTNVCRWIISRVDRIIRLVDLAGGIGYCVAVTTEGQRSQDE